MKFNLKRSGLIATILMVIGLSLTSCATQKIVEQKSFNLVTCPVYERVEVGEKIIYRFEINKRMSRSKMKELAEAKALEVNGNADYMLHPSFTIMKSKRSFIHRYTIIVRGYPVKYVYSSKKF